MVPLRLLAAPLGRGWRWETETGRCLFSVSGEARTGERGDVEWSFLELGHGFGLYRIVVYWVNATMVFLAVLCLVYLALGESLF